MKSVDIKSISTYINFNKENNYVDPKFKVGVCENIKIQRHFCKRLRSNLVWRGFFIKYVKNSVTWTYLIEDLYGQEIIRTFYKKELQQTNQK